MPADAAVLIGPLVVVLVLIALVLATRWAFSAPKRPAPSPADDGLLTRVATLAHRESALQLRALLSDAGIRSTVRFPGAHRAEVLVFPEDAGRARELAVAFGSGN